MGCARRFGAARRKLRCPAHADLGRKTVDRKADRSESASEVAR
jgi:hypothetical protein